jgi:phenylalanyl-tRNA synthetase alpha chain
MSLRLIDSTAHRRSLALRDLTDAALGRHAMQTLVHDAVSALARRWRCAVVVHRAPPIVSIADNYDALGYPPDAAARDARYTRYVAQDRLLRTQTSAMVPSALRMLAAARYDDVLLVCPGLTYRRDAIDRLHVGEPHQLDLWRIARKPLGRAELEEMIDVAADAMLPGAPLELRAATHPYTVDGLEVHAQVGGQRVEILECGLAAPRMLDAAGLSSAEHRGLAMGIGLDRMLMLRKGIPDIRALRSADPRVAGQMLDLAPYRPVSDQPAIRRDLSIAVAGDLTPEEIGDRAREALAERSASVEEILVLSETPYADLPPDARERLGIAPEQKNVLLRVSIRDLERTLTAAEANALRDEIYAALHAGTVHSWAAKPA